MADLEYYTSERFIHDELVRRAETALGTIIDTWRDHGRVAPFMVAWPADVIEDDHGYTVEDVVWMPLDENRSAWSKEMNALVARTKPYALLLCEQRSQEVVVIIESQHGTKSWHFPIFHMGNRFLGYRTEKKDAESIGILWRAKKAQA